MKKDLYFNNKKLPRGVCDNCRMLLQKFLLPGLFNFDSIQIKAHTGNSMNCECLIFKIRKLKLNEKHLKTDRKNQKMVNYHQPQESHSHNKLKKEVP